MCEVPIQDELKNGVGKLSMVVQTSHSCYCCYQYDGMLEHDATSAFLFLSGLYDRCSFLTLSDRVSYGFVLWYSVDVDLRDQGLFACWKVS